MEGSLTPEQLAKRWGKAVKTLSNWRENDKGPSYMKIGHNVFYKMEDVIAYEEERTVRPSKG